VKVYGGQKFGGGVRAILWNLRTFRHKMPRMRTTERKTILDSHDER